jgi:hypothetical protein
MWNSGIAGTIQAPVFSRVPEFHIRIGRSIHRAVSDTATGAVWLAAGSGVSFSQPINVELRDDWNDPVL